MSTAQRRRIGWLVMTLSLVAIVASFPVDGLAGAALVVLGVLLAVTADRLLVGAAGTAAIAIALEVTRWLKR